MDGKFLYKLYGMNLESDLELPQLVKLPSEEENKGIDVVIRKGRFPEELKREKSCWSEIKKPVALLSNDTCYLYIENGKEITYELKENSKNPQYLGSYILGWGMTILLWQLGELGIHCSCVANENGALLISGNSGSGKSTVTAFFLDHGYHLMADDIARVVLKEDGAYAYPAFPAQKFCRDVAVSRELDLDELIHIDEDKDKFLVPYEGPFLLGPEKVRTMVFLTKIGTKEPVFREMVGFEKYMTCLNALFLKPLLKEHLTDKENAESALKMASLFPIYLSARPFEGDTKAEVLNNLRALL